MKASLSYIFFTFLKIGSVAFGGYMALVALVQKCIVDKDSKLKEEELLDGISLTSVLPGPVAVNTVVYTGYKLRGNIGALLAFIGIILPSFLLVLLLSWIYFTYDNIPAVKNIFIGITPVIVALILSVAANMAKKSLNDKFQWLIGILSAIILIVIGGFGSTICIILISGLIGYMLYSDKEEQSKLHIQIHDNRTNLYIYGGLLIVFILFFLWEFGTKDAPLLVKIFSIFAGSSLTLFGGGYVVIPTLHELFVENLHWLSSSEFTDGIAIGQITPGPIFITATFIGYKVYGILGAVVATIGIFTPPAILTLFLSNFFCNMNKSEKVQAIMKGIRAAVIGMIFASAFIIGRTIDLSIPIFLIFLISLLISNKSNISPIYLILGGGIIGLFIF